MRLDKFISKSTEYSLTDAIALIENKRVVVNGHIASAASDQAHKNSVVTLDDKILTARSSRYFMLNKPVDTICSNIDERYPLALNLLDVEKVDKLHIAGRLDVDIGRWRSLTQEEVASLSVNTE